MKLIEDIKKLSKVSQKPNLLDIGGMYLETLAPHFSYCYSIIDDMNTFILVSNAVKKLKNVMVTKGDYNRIPMNNYSMVVVPFQDYESVYWYSVSAINNNLTNEPFFLVYPYGGSLGVSEFREKVLNNIGTPIGEHGEGMAVAIGPEHKKQLKESFRSS